MFISLSISLAEVPTFFCKNYMKEQDFSNGFLTCFNNYIHHQWHLPALHRFSDFQDWDNRKNTFLHSVWLVCLCTIMPFGFHYAWAIFQHFMNMVFQNFPGLKHDYISGQYLSLLMTAVSRWSWIVSNSINFLPKNLKVQILWSPTQVSGACNIPTRDWDGPLECQISTD